MNDQEFKALIARLKELKKTERTLNKVRAIVNGKGGS